MPPGVCTRASSFFNRERMEPMVGSCISAACALGLVILGILVMTRVVSLEEAAKAVGRVVLILVLVLIAVCLLRQLVLAGLVILLSLLKTLIRWLVVTVFVTALLILLVRMHVSKSVARLNAKSSRDGGEP